MSEQMVKAGLFGMPKERTNRDFAQKDNWGKNKFNSAFPVSLACYMHTKGLQYKHIKLAGGNRTAVEQISSFELFGLEANAPDLFFGFESPFSPYVPLVENSLDRTDLVTSKISPYSALRALEIKLTALPDGITSTKTNPEDYGSEMVVRTPTLIYLSLSLALHFKDDRSDLLQILAPDCDAIKDWTDSREMYPAAPQMLALLEKVVAAKLEQQTPLVIQPIWKTVGKSGTLCDDCFDLFVWSDLGFAQMLTDLVHPIVHNPNRNIRPLRCVFWLVRMLYDFAREGKINPRKIRSMDFGVLTDKGFAVSGLVTNRYMRCDELTTPRVKKEAVRDIILGGGEKYLSPERRLDAVIVNSNLFADAGTEPAEPAIEEDAE